MNADRRQVRSLPSGRDTPPCPHCLGKMASLTDLSEHLRFLCPVIRALRPTEPDPAGSTSTIRPGILGRPTTPEDWGL